MGEACLAALEMHGQKLEECPFNLGQHMAMRRVSDVDKQLNVLGNGNKSLSDYR